MPTVVTLTSNLGRIADHLKPQAMDHALTTAEHIVKHATEAMELPKTGRTYGGHVASAPGDAPAIATGELVNSLKAEPDDGGAVAYTEVDYAPHLEYGTLRMAARPFLTPAAEAERPVFEDGLRKIIDGRA